MLSSPDTRYVSGNLFRRRFRRPFATRLRDRPLGVVRRLRPRNNFFEDVANGPGARCCLDRGTAHSTIAQRQNDFQQREITPFNEILGVVARRPNSIRPPFDKSRASALKKRLQNRCALSALIKLSRHQHERHIPISLPDSGQYLVSEFVFVAGELPIRYDDVYRTGLPVAYKFGRVFTFQHLKPSSSKSSSSHSSGTGVVIEHDSPRPPCSEFLANGLSHRY